MDGGGVGAHIVILAPVLNDWANLKTLTEELDRDPGLAGKSVSIVAVDDGSTEICFPMPVSLNGCVREVQMVRLNANLGHQRAIALGLAHIYENMQPDFVVVMDSDGEDRPQDVARLVANAGDGAVVVAMRRRRSESFAFKAFYSVYKMIFGLLTGRAISFGNFCAIPRQRLPNILYHPSLWNNFAATVLKSRLPIVRIPTDRGVRYSGVSKMNFTSLVVHGVSAIAVFTDVVIGRVMLFLMASVGTILAAALVIVALRIWTTLLIPGYATYVILFLLNLLFVTSFTGFMLMLLLLSDRDHASTSPLRLARDLVGDVEICVYNNATPPNNATPH